jgi:hypothetical protein
MFTKKCKCVQFKPEIVNGYQFCLSCGKAHLVPKSEPQKGGHKLKFISESMVSNMYHARQTLILQQCEKCGAYFTYNQTTGHYESKRPEEVFCI